MSYKINYSTEEKIKLAKDDSVEKLYESKKNQRTMRVLTVCAYMLTVSMAAIILSSYYVFIWKPTDASAINSENPNAKCEKIYVPEIIAIRLANNSIVPVKEFMEKLKQMQIEAQSSMIGDEPMNRSEFNKYLKFKAIEIQQKQQQKKIRKRLNKKNQDDEDFNIDTESSGEKLVTTVFPAQAPDLSTDLNDTTIIFDQQDE